MAGDKNLNLKNKQNLFFIFVFSIWLISFLLVSIPLSGLESQTFPLTINNHIITIFIGSTVISLLTSVLMVLDKLGKLPLKKFFKSLQLPTQLGMPIQMSSQRRFTNQELFRRHVSEVSPVEDYVNREGGRHVSEVSPVEDYVNREGVEDYVRERTTESTKETTESTKEISLQDLFENLDVLKTDLKEFDKIKQGIRTRLTSIAKIAPRLNERKELLEKDVSSKQKGFQQLNLQVPKLSQQKEALLQGISQKQKDRELLEKNIHLEQEKVREITTQISKLRYDSKEIEEIIQQKQEEIAKIDDQIKEIKSIQEHGLDLISTLIYASKKAC